MKTANPVMVLQEHSRKTTGICMSEISRVSIVPWKAPANNRTGLLKARIVLRRYQKLCRPKSCAMAMIETKEEIIILLGNAA